MALFYIAAGANHFINPGFYAEVMPGWLPWHPQLLVISGVAEIVLGLLLLPSLTRPWAAWLIVAMLVVFVPLHIDMAVRWDEHAHFQLWAAIVRLPIQALLMVWAWVYTRPASV